MIIVFIHRHLWHRDGRRHQAADQWVKGRLQIEQQKWSQESGALLVKTRRNLWEKWNFVAEVGGAIEGMTLEELSLGDLQAELELHPQLASTPFIAVSVKQNLSYIHL